MIVLSLLLQIFIADSNAQSSEPKPVSAHTAVTNDPNKARIYVDKSGDKIIVLDFSTRNKMSNDVAKNFTNIYDQEAETKDIQARIIREAELKNGKKTEVYEVEEGDTLASISQKLYGNTSRVDELRLLNEDVLTSSQVSPGMNLKYYKVK